MTGEVAGDHLDLAEEAQCKQCQGKMLPLYGLKYLKQAFSK